MGTRETKATVSAPVVLGRIGRRRRDAVPGPSIQADGIGGWMAGSSERMMRTRFVVVSQVFAYWVTWLGSEESKIVLWKD